MSNEEIYKILESVGVPVAYNVFKAPQTPPYICYYELYSNNFFADCEVYAQIDRVIVELYVAKRDAELETKLEAQLALIGGYEKTDNYIDTEKLYKVDYELEVVR